MKTRSNVSFAVALVAAVALAALVSACSAEDTGANSPTDITKRFVTAARTKDVPTFKSLLSKESLSKMDADAMEAGINVDNMIAAVLEQGVFKASGAVETRNQKISGEKATVEFKQDNGEWSENELVREGENWKVSLV